eukprot:CAMPEP_0177639426 /NCGR_PEP_ID=MMETSP0447-20121125/6012_1 /TAXON_ID=0 /ORGANISM="Stygamoeba regulata, Strain BSH-02190019" /LENGTH=530 /DNA_ID=CAMNT_0019141447 /DNA_START=329 /DNA_END=1917 /DNA_ORIENTATION=-
MKVRCNIVQVDQFFSTGEKLGNPLSFTLLTEKSLDENMIELFKYIDQECGRSTNDVYSEVNDYCLQLKEGAYIVPSKSLESQLKGLLTGALIYLKVKPRRLIQEYLRILQGDPNSKDYREKIFNLRYVLKDIRCVEEFVRCNGMEKLLEVVLDSEGNVQAYALVAVRAIVSHDLGMKEFLLCPELIDKLWYLIRPETIASVTRQALELLISLTSYDGWALVHKAAKYTARVSGKQPYQALLSLLEGGDFDTQLYTITLINALVSQAPSSYACQKLSNHLGEMGIFESLRKGAKLDIPEFKAQVETFRAAAALHGVIDNTVKETPKDKKAAKKKKKRGKKDDEKSFSGFDQNSLVIQYLVSEVQRLNRAIFEANEKGANIPTGERDLADAFLRSFGGSDNTAIQGAAQNLKTISQMAQLAGQDWEYEKPEKKDRPKPAAKGSATFRAGQAGAAAQQYQVVSMADSVINDIDELAEQIKKHQSTTDIQSSINKSAQQNATPLESSARPKSVLLEGLQQLSKQDGVREGEDKG